MTSQYTPDAWRRLARLLKSRRVNIAADYRNRTTFCQATGLNYKLVSDIEGAPDTRTNFTDGYFALLEAGYQLAEGAIRRALDGHQLETRKPAPAEAAPEEREPAAVIDLPAPPADEVTQYLQDLLTRMDQRLTEVTQQLANQNQMLADQRQQLTEQNQRLEKLQRQQGEDENRKGA